MTVVVPYRSRRTTRTPPEQNERRCLPRHVYTPVMHASTEERHRLVPLPVNLSVRATTPHSRRAAAPAQEKLTEEEETRTGSCRSCLLPTTTTTTTSATTTSPTTSMMTTTTSTSDGSSASVTATPQLQHGDSRKICGSGNYSIPLVAKRVSSHPLVW
eukprot:CAMPEP_0170949828 /NCGR_PEP_ID=MMETSP0735-20130129/29533_1 /TAXON_ID=186038 /ORGANISM="Fragilariopsis kerguelensis, Strain L26-C5" /LENGTH=157 /DNA_ID=CAMNT_0011360017 /DNA_START=687 /DNA_END=1157 /DNA_ORIENTATION=+